MPVMSKKKISLMDLYSKRFSVFLVDKKEIIYFPPRKIDGVKTANASAGQSMEDFDRSCRKEDDGDTVTTRWTT